MNALLKLTLPLTACVALTACSLGSSGSTTITPNNPNFYGQTYAGSTLDDIKLVGVQSSSLKVLRIDGREYPLDTYLPRADGFNGQDENQLDIAVSNYLSHAKHGWVHDEKTNRQYAFYQGNTTPADKVPTSGTVAYSGRAVGACVDCDNQLIYGDVRLVADFGQKTLEGVVVNNIRNFELGAKIKGNQFAGKSGDGTETNGVFLGANAEEVSGVFINKNLQFGGSFGAKK